MLVDNNAWKINHRKCTVKIYACHKLNAFRPFIESAVHMLVCYNMHNKIQNF